MNYFTLLSKIADYIEVKWQNAANDTITIVSDHPRITDIYPDELDETLNKMMMGDEVIEIIKKTKGINSDTKKPNVIYELKVSRGFSTFAEGARYDNKSNADVSLRLYLDKDNNPYLTGFVLNYMKYKIFKSDYQKWLKSIFTGLIFHTQNIPKINIMELKSYSPDYFMLKADGVDWYSMSKEDREEYMNKQLSKEISEQCTPYFKKIYTLFIEKAKTNNFLFRPAISFSDIRQIEKRLGKTYEILHIKAMQSSTPLD